MIKIEWEDGTIEELPANQVIQTPYKSECKVFLYCSNGEVIRLDIDGTVNISDVTVRPAGPS